MRVITGFIVVLISVFLMSCQGGKQSNQNASGGALSTRSDIKLDGTPVSIAGITFTPPSEWKDLGASGMRQANYEFGPIESESDSATLAVFYFGKGQGGDVKSNVERWIGQMTMPDGSDPHKAAGQSGFAVEELPVHWVELSGTYMSGGMMGGPAIPKQGYRMAAAVLEAPEGNLFFKLTGPEKTAARMSEGFKAMIMRGIKKSSQT